MVSYVFSLGFIYFISVLMIGGLFVITISLTIIVSIQKEQIKNLIQEISILKSGK